MDANIFWRPYRSQTRAHVSQTRREPPLHLHPSLPERRVLLSRASGRAALLEAFLVRPRFGAGGRVVARADVSVRAGGAGVVVFPEAGGALLHTANPLSDGLRH